MKYLICTLFILFGLNTHPLIAASRPDQHSIQQTGFISKKTVRHQKKQWRFFKMLKNVFSKNKRAKISDISFGANKFGNLALFLIAANLIGLASGSFLLFLTSLLVMFIFAILGFKYDENKTAAIIAGIYSGVLLFISVLALIQCAGGGCL